MHQKEIYPAIEEKTEPSIFDSLQTYFKNGLNGGDISTLNRKRSIFDLNAAAIYGARVPGDFNIRWFLATDNGIQIVRNQEIWHSGRVNAVITDGSIAIIGTDTGGVWLVNPRPDAIPISRNFETFCLSHDWENPDIVSLAFLPGTTNQFFAGCYNSNHLYFVELTIVLGGMEPNRATPIPLPFYATIYQVTVLKTNQKIVIATDLGIWWSPVPTTPADPTGYHWQEALGLSGTHYAGLAEGPNESIVAATRKFGPGSSNPSPIYTGKFETGNLIFSMATISGTSPTDMLRISLTSCDANRSFMYAVASGSDEGILAVLASTDGGLSWHTTNKPVNAGARGSLTNCIAVSPFHPNEITIGWTSEDLFFSSDSGNSWISSADSGLHADKHALYFTRNSPGIEPLFIGSDGGCIATKDLGESYDSRYNKHLNTLQIYSNTLSVSSRFPGLITAGTQDNGNIFCYLKSNTPAWVQLEGGDGGANRFIDALGALLWNTNALIGLRISFWDPAINSFNGAAVIPVDGDPSGLLFPVIEIVRSPSWRLNGKLMYAVASNAGKLYGLFANADGTDASFSLLHDFIDKVYAVESADGNNIIVGTAGFRILSINTTTLSVSDLQFPVDFTATNFLRIQDREPGRLFAMNYSGGLFFYDGTTWNYPSQLGIIAFDAHPNKGSRRIFAMTENKVIMSRNNGTTWAEISTGLPACPHCKDLRLASDGNGGRDLYLATYGRSVWVAKVDFPDPVPIPIPIPVEVVGILIGVLGDGGGLITINGQIFRVPPRSPVTEIFEALVMDDIGRSLSNQAGKDMQLEAMKAIEKIAREKIKELTNIQ